MTVRPLGNCRLQVHPTHPSCPIRVTRRRHVSARYQALTAARLNAKIPKATGSLTLLRKLPRSLDRLRLCCSSLPEAPLISVSFASIGAGQQRGRSLTFVLAVIQSARFAGLRQRCFAGCRMCLIRS